MEQGETKVGAFYKKRLRLTAENNYPKKFQHGCLK